MGKRSGFTLTDLDRLKKGGKILDYRIVATGGVNRNLSALGGKETILEKKSKYGNSKVVIDGLKFDSGKEANRYNELKLLVEQKVISDLRLQVGYELNEGGKYSFKYYADFVYVSDGKEVVEDCKGFLTATYKKKKRLMKKIYGIDIKES